MNDVNRFDGFTREELDTIWTALYDLRKAESQRGEECSKLILQIYGAKNWGAGVLPR